MIHTRDRIHPLFRNILQPYLPDLQPLDPPGPSPTELASERAYELRCKVEEDPALFCEALGLRECDENVDLVAALMEVYEDSEFANLEHIHFLLKARIVAYITAKLEAERD